MYKTTPGAFPADGLKVLLYDFNVPYEWIPLQNIFGDQCGDAYDNNSENKGKLQLNTLISC